MVWYISKAVNIYEVAANPVVFGGVAFIYGIFEPHLHMNIIWQASSNTMEWIEYKPGVCHRGRGWRMMEAFSS